MTKDKVTVKVCGLTTRDDVLYAADAGAKYLGVIFAGGPRNISVANAKLILAEVFGAKKVAVIGKQSVDEIVDMQQELSLDVLQLHEERDIDEVTQITALTAAELWPVVRVGASGVPATALDLARTTGWLLLDSGAVGQLGGTGRTFDWKAVVEQLRLLRETVPTVRIVLAGGLQADNVLEAIRVLSPDVVDVSSGVELSPGVKDHSKVRSFIDKVQLVNG